MDDLKATLRKAFRNLRYGDDGYKGPYIPEGDLLDVAADHIEAMESLLRHIADTELVMPETLARIDAILPPIGDE